MPEGIKISALTAWPGKLFDDKIPFAGGDPFATYGYEISTLLNLGRTGLTGGGTANLDGTPTVEEEVLQIWNVVGSSVLSPYQLQSGTTAQSLPNVVRPLDYSAGDNPKFFQLCGFKGTSLTLTGLTAGRVPFVTTDGLITNASTLTFNSGTGALSATSFVGSGAALTGILSGPGSSTDNAVVRWDGTTGVVTQNSTVTISDAGLITTDGGITLSGASGAATTISTSTSNASLLLSPNGTGDVAIAGSGKLIKSSTGSYVNLTGDGTNNLVLYSSSGAVLYSGSDRLQLGGGVGSGVFAPITSITLGSAVFPWGAAYLSNGIVLSGASGAATTISTSTSNADLYLVPNGTGKIRIGGTASTTPYLTSGSDAIVVGNQYGGGTLRGASAAGGSGWILDGGGLHFYPESDGLQGIGVAASKRVLHVYQGVAGIGTTSTDGIVMEALTAAADGAQKISPRLRLTGNGWNTSATKTVSFFIETLPVQAATPTGILKFGYILEGVAATYPLTLASDSGDLRLGVVGSSYLPASDTGSNVGSAALRIYNIFVGPVGLKIGNGTNGPTISATGSASPNETLTFTQGSGTATKPFSFIANGDGVSRQAVIFASNNGTNFALSLGPANALISTTGNLDIGVYGDAVFSRFNNTTADGPKGGLSLGLANASSASWTTTGIQLNTTGSTYTNTSGAGTYATATFVSFAAPVLAGTATTTATMASTVYIAGAPTAGSGAAITNPFALMIGGTAKLGFGVTALASIWVDADTTAGNLTITAPTTGSINLNSAAGAWALYSGGFLMADGSQIHGGTSNGVGVPNYSFLGDTNTGMYRVGADQLGFATAGALALTLNATQGAVLAGTLIGTPNAQTTSTAAVSITTLTTKLTTAGTGDAITIADGTDGQLKTIILDVLTSGGHTAVLTPATKTGYTTITFSAAGQTATLQYVTTRGWMILSLRGAIAA